MSQLLATTPRSTPPTGNLGSATEKISGNVQRGCQPHQGCQLSTWLHLVKFVCHNIRIGRVGEGGAACPLDLPLVCTPFLNHRSWNGKLNWCPYVMPLCTCTQVIDGRMSQINSKIHKLNPVKVTISSIFLFTAKQKCHSFWIPNLGQKN